ncbi:MAG: hypothetical protein QM802_19910 [Agriterribacter sp.]
MSIQEAIARIDQIILGLDAELQKASEELALSLMGMIINRIQQQGLPGRKYSKNKLPAFYFYDRALNAGGRALYAKHVKKRERELLKEIGEKLRKNTAIDEMENGISYEEWRVANGLQVNHVDLTFSGRMLQNLGIVGTKRVGDYYVTVLGGTNEETKLRLEYNTIRFGRWFKPTQEEIDIVKVQFGNRIEAYLQRMAA